MDDVCRRAATDAAKKEIARYKPFDDPVFMDLLELVVRKLEVNALEIDREFIHELDALYLFAYGGGQRPLVRSRTAAVRSE